MKEKLDNFIQTYGLRHWSRPAKKDAEFMNWVNEQTKDFPEDATFSERVYGAVSGTSIFCKRGNRRKFKSINDGWAFCNHALKCACASEFSSEKNKAIHATKTAKDYAEREAKTKATNLERYGVANGGQMDKTREAHKKYYDSMKNDHDNE